MVGAMKSILLNFFDNSLVPIDCIDSISLLLKLVPSRFSPSLYQAVLAKLVL